MARIWQSGFELNSATSGVELGASGSPTISSTTKRSGGFAGRITSLVSTTPKWFNYGLAASAAKPYFHRFYLNIAVLPSAENTIFMDANLPPANSVKETMTLDNTGALRLYNNGVLVGSPSSALSTGTWYRIEIHRDPSPASGSRLLDARIDGVQFAGITNGTFASNTSIFYGGNLAGEAQTTGDWFFDDIAINDNVGSFQNTYCGAGSIIHLKPNAAGDANGFLVNVGGTVGAANNFTRVQEVTPDDATSYNGSVVLNAEDLFNCDNSGLTNPSVNVVMVGGRVRDLTADATTAIKFEIEKTASGTKLQSAAYIPNQTGFHTNTGTSAPGIYPIVTYQDPDGSNWTQTTLDSMQIGYTISAAGVNAIDVTTVWASVDYVLATIYNQSLAASYSTSGALNRRNSRSNAATMSYSAALGKGTIRKFTATYSASGVLNRFMTRILAGTQKPIGSLAKRTKILFTGTTSYLGSLIGGSFHAKAFTATMSYSGSIKRAIRHTLSGTLIYSGIRRTRTAKTFSASLMTSGFLGSSIPALLRRVLNIIFGIPEPIAVSLAVPAPLQITLQVPDPISITLVVAEPIDLVLSAT